MSAHPRFSRHLVFTLIVMIGGVGGRAQLATSSPFLPSQASGSSTAPTAGAPLEFRGMVDTPGEELKVRIYDPSRKLGAWLRVSERNPNYDFVVKQYDASRDTATVEYHGQTMVLAMHEGKVTSSGAAAPNIPLAQIQPPIMNGPPGVTNGTPASQTQLEAVAAAVAQRRALREQAAQQVNQGVSVAPQVIQQQQPQQRPQNNQLQNQNPNVQQRQRPGNRGG